MGLLGKLHRAFSLTLIGFPLLEWFPNGPFIGIHIGFLLNTYAPLLLMLPVVLYQRAPELAESVQHHTEAGWVGFRRDSLDVTDGAWENFRRHLPLMVVVATLQFAGKALVGVFVGRTTNGRPQLVWIAVFSVVLWSAVFGQGVALILAWVGAAYVLTPRRSQATRWHLAVAWAFNCGALHYMDGPLPAVISRALNALFAPLGLAEGLLPWTQASYFLALRCLSYSLDMHDIMLRARGESASAARFSRPFEYERLPPLEHCGFVAFVAYALYPPLFLAGPIMRFSDFVRQRKLSALVGDELDELRPSRMLRYALRFGFLYSLFEVLQHCLYPSAIVAYATDTSGQQQQLRPPLGLGFFVPLSWVMLTLTWCKYTLVWRFFRLWAMVDGTVPREDVTRCMSSNSSIKGFWRSFHATYNQWLVRYLFVPLGGSRGVGFVVLARNVVAVFGFVVFTHDRSLTHLDKYPWWFCVFSSAFVAESLVDARIARWHQSGAPERSVVALRCVVGALTILLLFIGNMLTYGFESGSAGFRFLVGGGSGGWDLSGVLALATYVYMLMIGVFGSRITLEAIKGGCPAAENLRSLNYTALAPASITAATASARRVHGALLALLRAPARALRTTPMRLLIVTAIVGGALLPAFAASLTLTGDAWAGLTIKSPPQHLSVAQHFDQGAEGAGGATAEYEACELVRLDKYVRAPVNAWSSAAFLLAPALVVMYAPRGRFGVLAAAITGGSPPTATAAAPSVSLLFLIGAAVYVWWGSFLYHASVTHEMNWIDVRGMYVGIGQGVLLDLQALVKRHCSARVSAEQRFTLFSVATIAWITTALFTDFLSHRYSTIMPSLFVLSVVFEIARAARFFRAAAEGGADAAPCRARARSSALAAALLVAALAYKPVYKAHIDKR